MSLQRRRGRGGILSLQRHRGRGGIVSLQLAGVGVVYDLATS